MMRAAMLLLLLVVPIASMRRRAIYSERNQHKPARAILISHRSCSQDPQAACNHHLFQQLNSLSDEAEAYPFVEHFLYQGLPSDILNDPKWEKHLEADKGRGYWFWKAALTNRLLKRGGISDGDIVVWIDADTGPGRLGSKPDWVEVLGGNFQEDFLVKDQTWIERDWTKGDIFKEFNVSVGSRQYGTSRQAHAQFWLLRVNEKTRELLSKWEKLVLNFHLVSDEKSVAPNGPHFRANRHDQSLLSMLLKASMIHLVGKNYQQQLHPEFGVRGLNAIQGGIGNLQRTHIPDNSSRLSPPTSRWICVRDDCYDLNMQPKGFVPHGVAPK